MIRLLVALLMLIPTIACAQFNGPFGSNNSSSGTSITSSDTGVLYSNGANTPATDVTHFYYDNSGKILHVDSVQTAATSVPQTQYYPSLTSDTHWIAGVNGDGGNNNNDNFVISEGTTLGSSNRLTIAPGGATTIPTLSSTTLTAPLLIGDTTTSGVLQLESTSGSGATDSIKFLTGSQSEKMRIINSGNVGIGSTAPGKQLDVQGTVRALYFTGDGSGLTGIVASGGTGTVTSSAINTVARFNAAGTTVQGSSILFDDGISVGIGSSAPGSQLDVGGTVRILNGGTVGIGTTKTTTAALTVMNGNVGIGTWVPSTVIDIKGNATYSGLFRNGELMLTNSATQTLNSNGALVLDISGSGSVDNVARWGAAYSGSSSLSGDLGFNGGSGIVEIMSQNGNLGIGASTTNSYSQKMIIQNNGNVGIGSTTPTGILDLGTSATPLTMPGIKSSSGTRYLCISTLGVVTSSAAACSGT